VRLFFKKTALFRDNAPDTGSLPARDLQIALKINTFVHFFGAQLFSALLPHYFFIGLTFYFASLLVAEHLLYLTYFQFIN